MVFVQKRFQEEKHENQWMTIQSIIKVNNWLTGLWLTDFPYYDHGKKQETNGITISCFFVWQFMVHSMICMSGQPG